jgi:hypothetical protein
MQDRTTVPNGPVVRRKNVACLRLNVKAVFALMLSSNSVAIAIGIGIGF